MGSGAHQDRNQGPGARGQGSGFTLVELLVVIGIMAVLMAITVPSYIAMSRQNRRATCASNLKAIGQTLAMFKEDYGCYPPDATEYLWTPTAAEAYKTTYGEYPSNYDSSEPFSLVAAAYHPNGDPYVTTVTIDNPDSPDPDNPEQIEVGFHGLGLFTLYYIGAYSSVLPPLSSDPRCTKAKIDEYQKIHGIPDSQHAGYSQFSWFKGSGYISNLKVFHCPENDDGRYDATYLPYRAGKYAASSETIRYYLPLLPPPAREGETVVSKYNQVTEVEDTLTYAVWREPVYNNYDQFYRRNLWNPGVQPPSNVEDTAQGKRHLHAPNAPSDTVITWCPYHHQGYKPLYPGDGGAPDYYAVDEIEPGDFDLVLFADGTVRRMATRQDGRIFESPTGDTGWPAGPIM